MGLAATKFSRGPCPPLFSRGGKSTRFQTPALPAALSSAARGLAATRSAARQVTSLSPPGPKPANPPGRQGSRRRIPRQKQPPRTFAGRPGAKAPRGRRHGPLVPRPPRRPKGMPIPAQGKRHLLRPKLFHAHHQVAWPAVFVSIYRRPPYIPLLEPASQIMYFTPKRLAFIIFPS